MLAAGEAPAHWATFTAPAAGPAASPAAAPVTAPAGDDVTGIEPIPGRNVVYVCEGGELRIYDTTTAALTANQSDIIGKAVDVRAIF